MAIQPSANEACDKIIQEIRSSKLNFVISESPYSAQISLRKRFLKEYKSQQSFSKLSVSQDELAGLKLENQNLNRSLVETEAKALEFQTTIKILEKKLDKCENEAMRGFENSKIALDKATEDNKVLKVALKNANIQILLILGTT